MFELSAPENSYDYHEWLKIFNSIDLSDVGSLSQQKVNDLTKLFVQFLTVFPHLHVFWSKYAQFVQATTGSLEDALNVYHEALTEKNLLFSIDMWTEYLRFVVQNTATEDSSRIREVYAEALDKIGWHFRSSQIWESAIEFEVSQGRNPFFYYAKSLFAPKENIIKLNKDFQAIIPKTESEKIKSYDFSMPFSAFISLPDDIMSSEFAETEDPERVEILKMLSVKYEESVKEYKSISVYESQITRSYFHFKTPDEAQVSVWEQYADWSIKANKPTVYTTRIYERALIPCEHIDGIWIQYALFLEDKGMIEEARNVYQRIPFDILHRAKTYYLAFEEQNQPQKANEECTKDSTSNFAELVTYSANYYLRNGDFETAKQILIQGIETAEQSEDFHRAGLLSSVLMDTTKEPAKLVPQSPLSIMSYTTKAGQEEANTAFFYAVFGEDSKLLLEDKVTIAELYLEYCKVLNIDIKFQNQLETTLNDLKNKLVWHKDYFKQYCIIYKIDPEAVPQEWFKYQSTI